jgi:hypothetical protein
MAHNYLANLQLDCWLVTTSVVVPVFQGAGPLARTLAALASSSVAPHEIIVVDDGSTDGSGEVARAAGARVVTVPHGPRGPAAARNLGAASATGSVLLFLDADVAVHADTIARVQSHFAAAPEASALFGSYDDRPAHGSLVSQYRNLLHHFVHQHARRDAWTFWAGCGAIRRDALAAIGGFDERFTRPSIEDIDLGGRLRRAGHRILLCPDIQVTHLKRWTFAAMVTTDVRDRAIPWTRALLAGPAVPADLNIDVRSRLSAAVAWLAVAAMLTAPVFGWWLTGTAAGAMSLLLLLNRQLYALLWRRGGLRLTSAGIGLHALYFLYSSAVFAALALATVFTRRRG